ncbi:MAG: WD40 repeat domain-containing protein, partial [Xenococcaceae cyanobacterium]
SVIFLPILHDCVDRQEILASGSKDKTVRLWDVSTGQCLKILEGHTGWVTSVACSAPAPAANSRDSSNLLASGSTDATVKLWNVGTGECLKTFQGHTHWIRSVAFCPQGKILASSSEDETVKLWDISTGECIRTLRSKKPYEGMNVTGVTGLTVAAIASLKALGAVEHPEE